MAALTQPFSPSRPHPSLLLTPTSSSSRLHLAMSTISSHPHRTVITHTQPSSPSRGRPHPAPPSASPVLTQSSPPSRPHRDCSRPASPSPSPVLTQLSSRSLPDPAVLIQPSSASRLRPAEAVLTQPSSPSPVLTQPSSPTLMIGSTCATCCTYK